jgi:hypothetical protein
MANKKISQLVGIGTGSTVSGTFLLPVGAGSSTGPYTTNKITTSELASYIFTGDSGGGGFPATNLSGQKDVYFNNPNWQDTTSAADGTNYAYVMVKADNGLLTTGSGIARPVGGDNLGNHTATQNLNMQDYSVSNVNEIDFQDGGNIGSTAARIELTHATKLQFDAPTIQIGESSDSITVDGSFNVDGDTTANSANFAGTITGDAVEIQGASYHNPKETASNLVDWRDSNIQYKTINSTTQFRFVAGTPKPGQTLTMYVENSNPNLQDTVNVSFISGVVNNVVWESGNYYLDPKSTTNGCPGVTGSRTNVYTFVVIQTGIFASAVTGYVY